VSTPAAPESLSVVEDVTPPPPPSRGSSIWLGIWAALSLLIIAVMLFVELPREASGILVLLGMTTLLLVGVPIAFSMLIMGLIGLWKVSGTAAIEATLATGIYSNTASWSLSVIPMFIFMGIVLWRSGLTSRAFVAASQWMGRLPGGLALGTNFAGAGLAAASGSTVGISFALGRVAIPEMMKAGYSPALATGSVAMVGTLGQLIPPSIMLVIYAGIASVPVGPLLLASTIPGILLAVLFGLTIIVLVLRKPSLAPPADMAGVTWKTRFASLTGVVPLILIIVLIIGGLFGGWFTPTEAGAVAAIAAIISGIAYQEERSLKGIFDFVFNSAIEAARSTAIIFLLLITVDLMNRVMTLSGVSQGLADFIIELDMSRVTLLLVLVVFYFLLGMALEPLAIMLLTVPALTAGLLAAGVDMMWFGVFIVMLCEIAIVSPPVGMLVFIVHRLAQRRDVNMGVEISLNTVYRGVVPFVVVALLLLVVLILFPDLALWLPRVAEG
jgi:C4-dicarboxylate transporter DctM subunit